jgi:hypothetical protein
VQQFRCVAQVYRVTSGVEQRLHGHTGVPTTADACDVDVPGLAQQLCGVVERGAAWPQRVGQRFAKFGGFVQDVLK